MGGARLRSVSPRANPQKKVAGKYTDALQETKVKAEAVAKSKSEAETPAPQVVAKTPAPQAAQTTTSNPNDNYWDYTVNENVWDDATQTIKTVKSTTKNLKDQGLVSSTAKPSTSSTNSNAETKAAALADAYVKNTMQEQKEKEIASSLSGPRNTQSGFVNTPPSGPYSPVKVYTDRNGPAVLPAGPAKDPWGIVPI